MKFKESSPSQWEIWMLQLISCIYWDKREGAGTSNTYKQISSTLLSECFRQFAAFILRQKGVIPPTPSTPNLKISAFLDALDNLIFPLLSIFGLSCCLVHIRDNTFYRLHKHNNPFNLLGYSIDCPLPSFIIFGWIPVADRFQMKTVLFSLVLVFQGCKCQIDYIRRFFKVHEPVSSLILIAAFAVFSGK